MLVNVWAQLGKIQLPWNVTTQCCSEQILHHFKLLSADRPCCSNTYYERLSLHNLGSRMSLHMRLWQVHKQLLCWDPAGSGGECCVCVSVVQVMVASSMASQLKPHQWDGVRFLWRNIVLDHEVWCHHLLLLNCRSDCYSSRISIACVYVCDQVCNHRLSRFAW